MNKLFLPLALLALVPCFAMDSNRTLNEPTAEQIEMQKAYLQNAGAQMLNNLLQNNEALAAWFDDASDDEKDAFADLCVKYATLNLIVLEQNKPFYNQLFDAFTDLTGYTGWFAQLNFMSKEVAAALQAQQLAQASGSEEYDESDDLE